MRKDFGKDFDWSELMAKGSVLAMALAARKDKILELVGKLYDSQSGKLKVMDWPRRVRSLGRLITAYSKGEYKNISPLFWVNMSVSFTYLTSNFKINGKKILNLGILDDLAVVFFILESIGNEIRKFEMWEVDQRVKNIKLA